MPAKTFDDKRPQIIWEGETKRADEARGKRETRGEEENGGERLEEWETYGRTGRGRRAARYNLPRRKVPVAAGNLTGV